MKKIIAGNWKMYLNITEATRLLEKLDTELPAIMHNAEVVVFPNTAHLGVFPTTEHVILGAQRIAPYDSGAYTGQISSGDATALSCRYVLVGHSEARGMLGDTDDAIAQQVGRALAHNMIPIICVGENEKERGSGMQNKIIKKQLQKALSLVASPYTPIVAYEPIWAIGTGNNCPVADAEEMAIFIKNTMNDIFPGQSARVLYGGSVQTTNAHEYLSSLLVDGLLVGKASTVFEEYKKIISLAL